MKPLYFGSSERRLFGIYQPPVGGERRARGVLLCYPGVQEYNAAHWAFRRLAAMLARNGLHVFRFDYFGTGDSSGELTEATLESWVDDVRQAGAELLDQSGARSLSVVGLRLGAALALHACAAGLRVEDLVLWEPTADGEAYVRELESWHKRRNLLLLHSLRARRLKGELLGFPFPAAMRRELERLNLCHGRRPDAERVTILGSRSQQSFERLQAALEALGATAALEVVEDASAGQAGGQDKALLSSEILVAMTRRLSGALAA